MGGKTAGTLATIVIGMGLGAAAAAAKDTEVELGLSGLEYSRTQSKVELDDASVENDDTDLRTLDPSLSIELYSGKLWLGADLDLGADGTGGRLGAGYAVGTNLYVGGILGIDNTKSKQTNDSGGAGTTSTDSTTEDNLLSLGPVALYRMKSSKSLVDGGAALIYVRGKSSDDNTTTTYQVTALQLTGDYLLRVVDRLYLGPGISVAFSLQGKGKVETDNGSADGDYKLTQLTIAPLEIKLEI